MEVKFDLNSKDMWEFGKYVTFKNLRFKLRLIKNILLFGIIIFLYGAFSKYSLPTILLMELVLVSGYVYVQLFVLKIRTLKVFSTKGVYIGKHIIEIKDNGIFEILPSGEDFHEWNRYIDLKQNDKYIYVFWDQNVGNIIPKRAFESKSEQSKFFELLERNVKSKNS